MASQNRCSKTELKDKARKITQEYEIKRNKIINFIDSLLIGDTAVNLEHSTKVIEEINAEIIKLK